MQNAACNSKGRIWCCIVASCAYKCTHATYRRELKSESSVSQVSVIGPPSPSASSSVSSCCCIKQAVQKSPPLWEGIRASHDVRVFSAQHTWGFFDDFPNHFYPIQLALSKLVISLPNCILFFFLKKKSYCKIIGIAIDRTALYACRHLERDNVLNPN